MRSLGSIRGGQGRVRAKKRRKRRKVLEVFFNFLWASKVGRADRGFLLKFKYSEKNVFVYF